MSQTNPIYHESKSQNVWIFRLDPGADVKIQLSKWVQTHQIQAAVVLSAVGSLNQFHLRMAGASLGTLQKGSFEIVSMTGTLGLHGLHLHMSVSDSQGATLGGHLLDENLVLTTLEFVLLEMKDIEFQRRLDTQTSYKELFIQASKK